MELARRETESPVLEGEHYSVRLCLGAELRDLITSLIAANASCDAHLCESHMYTGCPKTLIPIFKLI